MVDFYIVYSSLSGTGWSVSRHFCLTSTDHFVLLLFTSLKWPRWSDKDYGISSRIDLYTEIPPRSPIGGGILELDRCRKLSTALFYYFLLLLNLSLHGSFQVSSLFILLRFTSFCILWTVEKMDTDIRPVDNPCNHDCPYCVVSLRTGLYYILCYVSVRPK